MEYLINQRKIIIQWATVLMMGLWLATPAASAQDEPLYDEISVFLQVQRVGGIEIPALYADDQVYLPVKTIFDFLRIKCVPSPSFDQVSGFFINPEVLYSIDLQKKQITFDKKTFALKPGDAVRTDSDLYLRSNFYGEIFGLDCTFNFRTLSVAMATKVELPVIKEMRLNFARTKIPQGTKEVTPDTVFPASRPFFRLGMADWSVVSNQEIKGESKSRFNLNLGSTLAGGEATVGLQYYSNETFRERDQYYRWRYVNNDFKLMRQFMAGKIYTQSISSIYSPVVGVQFTNAPTTYRRSFGTYTLSDFTEPEWSVELYVNNVLIDYKKADASGFFTFEVPMMYGNTNVLLRFYGPFGEEKSKQQTIIIPYNFLPAKELQYTVSAGMVEDSLHGIFSKATANYGVGKSMTVGGGVEYLSTVTSGAFMPFVNTSVQLGPRILFTGEYTYGVRGKGMLNYRTSKNFQIELNYSKYDPNQQAIISNLLEERRVMVSVPILSRNFAAYTRVAFTQNILPTTQYSIAEWLVSGMLFGVSTNLSTFAILNNQALSTVYSNLTLGFRFPNKFILRPQVQFNYTDKQLVLARAELEKQIFKKGFLNISFENNFRSNYRNFQLGFRYDFSFAQTGFTFLNSNKFNMITESARGSLILDSKTRYAGATNRTSVGRGGIVIVTFLDFNGNQHRDKGEPKIPGLKININGGQVENSQRDTLIRIFDLEPYTSYMIELNNLGFDNIAWQLKLKNMSVMVDPNQFKLVELPITVMGEATGSVTLTSPDGDKGQGRITVLFSTPNGKTFARTLSEPDGFFSFLGLPAGEYRAKIDPEQMRKLGMIATPEEIPFTIKGLREGDVMDGLDFRIRLINPPPPQQQESPKAEIKPDEKIKEAPPSVQEAKVPETAKNEVPNPAPVKAVKKFYVIQIAASKTNDDPVYYQEKFGLTETVSYYFRDGWYKYVIGRFATAKEANTRMAELGVSGFVSAVDTSLELLTKKDGEMKKDR